MPLNLPVKIKAKIMKDYISPKVYEAKFTCPSCGAIARQQWIDSTWDLRSSSSSSNKNLIAVGTCDHCEKKSLWLGSRLVSGGVLCGSGDGRGGKAQHHPLHDG